MTTQARFGVTTITGGDIPAEWQPDREYPCFCRPCGGLHVIRAKFLSADFILMGDGTRRLTHAHAGCAAYVGALFAHMTERNPGRARPDGRDIQRPFLAEAR
jgi:hypothetical protein